MASFTLAEARTAARSVRGAEFGRRATRSVRGRRGPGQARRAPLSLLLWVASRDGLVVTDGRGGFAVLEPPLVDRSDHARGGPLLRILRRLDRHWDLAVLALPPALSMIVALAFIPFAPAGLVGASVVLLLGMAWVAGMMTLRVVADLGWLSRLGTPSTAEHGRAAESLPGSHWAVALLHQPDPDRTDALLRALLDQVHGLLLNRARRPVAEHATIRLHVTETPVFLVSGITTEAAREALASSPRVMPSYSAAGDVILLQPPSRPERVPRPAISGGGFFLLYVVGVAVALAVIARFVADTESSACTAAATCAGHPVTYSQALRWLLQRLWFSDPPGLSPLDFRDTVLGWLVSVLTPTGAGVLAVAAGQEIRRNREVHETHEKEIQKIVQRSSVLILVVAEVERDAVLRVAARETGRPAVLDQRSRRTVYSLGSAGEADLYLAQAGEQGNAAAAGMMVSALQVINHLQPDFVVLTGICYGLRPEEGQSRGDIVIARRVQGVDHRKVGSDGRVVHRGVNVGSSPLLLDRFQAGQVSGRDLNGARVHVGTVLTSNTLVDNVELVERLRSDFPDAVAGEMEGTGVYEATTEEIRPDWILVKAISDWGYDMEAGRGDQAAIADRAAEFVLHVLTTTGLPTRRA